MRRWGCLVSFPLCLSLFLGAQSAIAAETGKKLAGAEAGNYLEQDRRQAPTTLVSGVAAPFAFPSVTQPTLFVGDNSFVINVPTGATRLDITLTTTTGAADLDLYVRYGADVNLSAEGRPEADHSSSGNTGNERVQIDATGWNGNDSNDVYQRYSTPVLRAGVYYIGLGLFTTGIAPSGTITATVTGGGGGSSFNLVGPWDWNATCNTGSFSGQFQIGSQQANGTIAGNFIGSQTGTINGLINGNQVIFSRSFDTRQQQWSGTLQGSAGSLTMQGTVLESNPQTSCSFTAHQNSGGGLSLFLNQVIQTNCATPKVIASVTSNGVAVTGLTVSNFTLKEDSQVRTVTVTSVSGGTGGSLTAAIVIDTSTSLSSSDLDNEKQAARELVNRLSSSDRIAVFAFGSTVSLLQDFTTNKTALTDAINSISLGGSTALYTAIDTAARALLSQTGRKAIVLMTDGEDTVGGVTLQQAIDSAKAAGAPVFTIGFGGANSTVLGQIASQTGAFFTPAASSSDLQRITTAISQVVSSQYEITYSTSSISVSHTIEVTVTVSVQTSTVTRTVGSCTGGGGGGGGGTCPSLTATRLELGGGSYSAGTFSPNGNIWDTDPSTAAWLIGVSDTSGPTAPFFNRSDGSIGIPAGAYYAYIRPENYGTAVQVSVTWSDGSTSVSVFQVGTDPFNSANWTRLAGSTNIGWARHFVTDVDRVRGQNGAAGFGQDGSPDELYRLTLDCPGSGGGGGGGGGTGPTIIINQVIPACPQEKLVVSVTDSFGVAITGLTVSNFVLKEDTQTRTITVTNVQNP